MYGGNTEPRMLRAHLRRRVSVRPRPVTCRASRAASACPRWRRILVAVLVVLGCIFVPLSVLSVWMKTTLLDTNNYVATVAPLADNSSVQNAIADRVTNTLIVNNSVDQRIVDRLPKPGAVHRTEDHRRALVARARRNAQDRPV